MYANTAAFLHRFDDAEQALAQAEGIPGTSAYLRIALLEARALLSLFRGDLETAARMFEQLRKEHRSLGNTRGEQIAALNLAEVEHARGQTQRAIAIVRETLPAARSGTDKYDCSPNCFTTSRAISPRWTIFPARSQRLARRLGSMPRASPDHAHVAIAIEHLALVFALRGDSARAATLEGYADAALRRHGFTARVHRDDDARPPHRTPARRHSRPTNLRD